MVTLLFRFRVRVSIRVRVRVRNRTLMFCSSAPETTRVPIIDIVAMED